MPWTKAEEQRLVSLARQNKYFYTEIAERIGKPVQVVRWKARELGLESTQKTLSFRFGKWNQKHAHLREAVFRYFLNHTWDETRDKFKLNDSGLKSIFASGYRDQKLKHLRKDKRRKDPWSTRELKFLLQHTGLKPRLWISKKLKRGLNDRVVKEKLQQLGLSSRTLQGITLSQFQQAFGRRPHFYIQSQAGPSRESVKAPTLWKIVPWVWLGKELKAKRLKAPMVFRKMVATQALFQDWIYEGDAIRKMKKICK